jgi:hypothetical protein
MTTNPFRNKVMRGLYEGCQSAAANNWSEMYASKTTAGVNPMGPNAPRRGAGHRCAYWDGRQDRPSLYERSQGTVGYACWAAGRDDRKEDRKK